jgi:DNA-binding response OmpR family regulator
VQPPNRIIAILDDEPDFRRALARLLKSHGYDAVPFATGQALLAAVAAFRFDCILLDLARRGVPGYAGLVEGGARPQTPPVIVVTAHDEQRYTQRAFALEAFACHGKPVRAPELVAAIERACAP